jgi:hypothetical protein
MPFKICVICVHLRMPLNLRDLRSSADALNLRYLCSSADAFEICAICGHLRMHSIRVICGLRHQADPGWSGRPGCLRI